MSSAVRYRWKRRGKPDFITDAVVFLGDLARSDFSTDGHIPASDFGLVFPRGEARIVDRLSDTDFGQLTWMVEPGLLISINSTGLTFEQMADLARALTLR